MSSDIINQLEMNNAVLPTENIMVGGQPSIADLKVLQKHGVKLVVNLRPETEPNDFEEKTVVEELGMQYCHIPLSHIDTFTLGACEKLHHALRDNSPCLIHCASGNRVGAILALTAHWLDEIPAEQALEFGKQSGLTILEPKISELLTK